MKIHDPDPDPTTLKRVQHKPVLYWFWGVVFLFTCNDIRDQEHNAWNNSLKPEGKAGGILILAEEGNHCCPVVELVRVNN